MTAELHQHFRALAAYNQAANRDLYSVVATLPEAEYFGMRPSFFGTLHATLNHLLLIDGVWFGRVAGTPSVATDHREILCPDLDSLAQARVAADQWIIGVIDDLDYAVIGQPLSYTTMDGAACSNLLRDILTHAFNHQTHHRGQVHGMLSQTKVAPPPLDYFTEADDGSLVLRV